MHERPGPRTDELLRRLRAWPASCWTHGDRIGHTRTTLSELAAAAAAARQTQIREVPRVGPHALGDQLTVLVQDARRAGVPAERVDAIVIRLTERLGLYPSPSRNPREPR